MWDDELEEVKQSKAHVQLAKKLFSDSTEDP